MVLYNHINICYTYLIQIETEATGGDARPQPVAQAHSTNPAAINARQHTIWDSRDIQRGFWLSAKSKILLRWETIEKQSW